MLLRPLFFTSFLIDDQLDDEGLTGRGPILISSASSKTAIAAAFLLARRDGVELVGLTSPRSAEFVAGLGIYDHTVTYERLARSSAGRHLRRRRRQQRGARHRPLPLRRRAGPRHGGRGHPLGGLRRRQRSARPDSNLLLRPRPRHQALHRLGPSGLEQRVAEAWHPFCEWISDWLRDRARARASRPSAAPTWMSSRDGWTRRRRTCSRSIPRPDSAARYAARATGRATRFAGRSASTHDPRHLIPAVL